MSNGDMECALRACRLLHSTNVDSAELLRLYLDEAIKQKYSVNKTITSVLRKEILDEEQKISNLSSSCNDSDNASHDDSMVEGLKNLLQDDLTCIICRDMDVTAGNRLVECSGCHSLYHQECHKPPIPEQDVNDSEINWHCSECKTESPISIRKPHKERTKESSKDSHTKSPSTSSNYVKLYSGGSKSSSKGESNSKSVNNNLTMSTSSPKVTPHIKILTPDKHIQNLKRKSSKQGETRRKHI